MMQRPSPGSGSIAVSRSPLDRTAVEELTLSQFRSYASLTLAVDGRPVVLTGPNGAGKTNLLEAISFLTPGRGLRRAELKDLIPMRGDGAETAPAVSAVIRRCGEAHRVGTAVERSPTGWRRVARIDGTLTPAYELAHYVRAVWATPTMDRLFTDGAAVRRRFLDRLAMAHRPGHAAAVIAYERALKERKRLLDEGVRDPAWLAAVEHNMSERGVVMAAGRRHAVARIEAALTAGAASQFPRGVLTLDGELERALAVDAPETVAAAYRDGLAASRRRDAEAGRALVGPHRTDLKVRHGSSGRPADLCSTGEQKALLVGLVLAQARALKSDEEAGTPILLLDEIAAHLDETRRGALYDEIRDLGCQAWLTGTDRALFLPFGKAAQFFTVADGRVLTVLG